jgi:ubiquinone/menaquinone biosynthesis C-methylase UbiE
LKDSDSTSRTPFDVQAFKRFEKRGWVDVAGRYESVFGPLTRQAIEPLLDAAGVRAGGRVLDVACGPGHLAGAASRRGATAVGVDFSPTMLVEARRLHPEVEFREGDAEALPFDDASFDAVVIGFGMLHFAEPDRAAREAFRVLAPGGAIAFSVWDAPERAPTFAIVRGAIERHGNLDVSLPPGPDFFRFSDPAEAQRVLESAGFRGARVERLALVWRIAGTDAIVDGFLEAGVRTRGLLLAQTAEALAAIRRGVDEAARPYATENGLELPTPCVIASARKP